MDFWPWMGISGFDLSKLKFYDQNELDNLRNLYRTKKFEYKERLPYWWEPETPGKTEMSGFLKKERFIIVRKFNFVDIGLLLTAL